MSHNRSVGDLLLFFEYKHLPESRQKYSKPFHDLATEMADSLYPSDELLVGLRKLLEAKDCFVRAGIHYERDKDRAERVSSLQKQADSLSSPMLEGRREGKHP